MHNFCFSFSPAAFLLQRSVEAWQCSSLLPSVLLRVYHYLISGQRDLFRCRLIRHEDRFLRSGCPNNSCRSADSFSAQERFTSIRGRNFAARFQMKTEVCVVLTRKQNPGTGTRLDHTDLLRKSTPFSSPANPGGDEQHH